MCIGVCAHMYDTFSVMPSEQQNLQVNNRALHTYINISHSMVSPVYICSLYYSIFVYSPIVVCFAYIHISQCDSSFTSFLRTVLIFGNRGTSEVRKIYKMFKYDSSLIKYDQKWDILTLFLSRTSLSVKRWIYLYRNDIS